MSGRTFGTRLTADGASFRLWAPAAKHVELLLDKPHAMTRDDDGWFTAGKLKFVSGANANLSMEVKIHRVDSTGVLIELWQMMPELIAVGDSFVKC